VLPRRRSWFAITTLAVCLAAGAGCKAYQFGTPTMHRFEIRTIHVPIIESDSFRRYLGVRLTEAVVKEIELNTPFALASPERADSFLVARIRRDTKQVLAETANDDPRVVQTGLRVEVSWTDRNGAPLMNRQVLRIDQSVDFIPEGGQSLTTAQQELIDEIARQIVGQMEIPW
jgi:hypothetical protein